MIYRCRAFPRAALIGNPSDGYFGKTIAFVFNNYAANVELFESPEIELALTSRDHNYFNSIDELVDDIKMNGYYGGIRLLKAAIKQFYQYTQKNGIELSKKNFTLRYNSNIPNRLGLAGSSAIITAALRAILQFYEVQIPADRFANLILAVEKEELGIPAGLQDRVAQAYNQPVYMDFDKEHITKFGVGKYTPVEISSDIPLYIAYRTDLAEGSEILHSRLRDDFESGDLKVVNAMKEWASLTDQMLVALKDKNYSMMSKLLNKNFDLRCEVCNTAISEKNRQMVTLARSIGASAKFTGSGGAIIGLYDGEEMFTQLGKTLGELGIEVIKPNIVNSCSEAYYE